MDPADPSSLRTDYHLGYNYTPFLIVGGHYETYAGSKPIGPGLYHSGCADWLLVDERFGSLR